MAKGFKTGGRTKGAPKTGGRQKGTPNKITRALKDMILEALHEEGGVAYLREQAREQPAAFMALVGKVLPLQISGEHGGPVRVQFEWIGEQPQPE